MVDPSLQALLETLKDRYGDRMVPYACNFDEVEHGFAFRLAGVAASFSVLTLDGSLPFGRYDVQIEPYPPDGGAWADEYDLDDFLKVVSDVERDIWPHESA